MSSNKFDPFVAEWKSFVRNPNHNLVEKCLKLGQLLEYPELDVSRYVQEIADMGKALKLAINNSDNPTYRVSMLNEHFFRHHGFHGDLDDYYNPKNNFLNDVIDRKLGIPITLSIIYAEVGRHVGLDLRLAGFPSHVVVKNGEEMVLDPFNEGRRLTIDDLREILLQTYGGEIEFTPEFLNDMTEKQILTRMTRNLKNSYVQSYAYDKAMRCIDMVLALQSDSPEEIRDKGILEERLLNHDKSLGLLNQYLEINPNAEDADFVLDLIKSIREKSSR